MFRKKALRINTYLGYGTNTLFRATGRALEDENVDFSHNQGTLKTLRNIYRQFESDEVRNVSLTLKLPNNQTIEASTDHEGYYHLELEIVSLSQYLNKTGWVTYSVSYKEEETKKEISNLNTFASEMLIPSKEAEYGVISDIDDTILHTGVASFFKWRVIVNTIFKNFDKRKAIDGTVKFYKRLQLGKKNNPKNPFFYVSNSPWNLYDYLNAFFKKNNFPKGPILLRDFRTPFDKTPKPKMPHKLSEILNLLKMYPEMKFILIGDSGEKDADIYTKIAQDFPGRILAIYLRNVNHRRKEKRIKKIIQSFDASPILLVHSAEEAMEHATKLGLIN
ncbi:phosphatase domain-containing protein [Aquimarina gracilis]|uniref:Phosphatase domain-containing protein n=1 Tax=Aquimarina gracilis TaxID=874422 RepID=A0ABU5ZPH7_9FLAO|nr:phosphatase domain-containing protein [Aquimarina gracilis]MEB3344024.1 phosphatase domain-containing protein [Aquimarina gracilis]